MSRTPVNSLVVAREKLLSLIEIYAPVGGHAAAVGALGAVVVEFEAAVREDERAVLLKPVAPTESSAVEPPAFNEEYDVTFKNRAAPSPPLAIDLETASGATNDDPPFLTPESGELPPVAPPPVVAPTTTKAKSTRKGK